MLKYYIDDLRIAIATLEGNKEYVIALLIDENLNLVTYSFRESHAYEVLMTKAFYKLGFIPEVEYTPKTEKWIKHIIRYIRMMPMPLQVQSIHFNQSYSSANRIKLRIDKTLKFFIHEYKFNSEMMIGEKRLGSDGKLYEAVISYNCQGCSFEGSSFEGCCKASEQLGLGACVTRNRSENRDDVIFKLIER